jgi:hypothetical protein
MLRKHRDDVDHGEGVVMEQTASRVQHALRLVTLLRVCAEPVGGGDPPEMVGVIRAEKRLQALDFWLRNPDYLADEILNLVQAQTLNGAWVQTARDLLTESEPQLHHYPMPKWFYGAYEAVDDAMALLETYGLAKVRRRGTPPKRLQNSFFLTGDGAAAADSLASSPGLGWYVTQAQLVSEVAGGDSGNKLKARQYAQEAYAATRWGQPIGSIDEQVRKRLAEDFDHAGLGTGQHAERGSA